jgi:hypothetical protein
MPTILPWVSGLSDWHSTASDRSRLNSELSADFERLEKQLAGLLPDQIAANRRLGEASRVITHDVLRTDRQLKAFKGGDTVGTRLLTKLLNIYARHNPPLGYLQGMNDLFVPLIRALLPLDCWNDSGTPLDESGNEVDVRAIESKLFWCFDAFLKHTGHLRLLTSVTEQCRRQAGMVIRLLDRISPVSAIWMRKKGLQDLLWFYSDLVLLFKRSYADVWPVWLKISCAPEPAHWIVYFTTAIHILAFERMTQLPDVQITAIMDLFPKLMATLDVNFIGQVAQWVHEVAPLEKEVIGVPAKIETDFSFFAPDWSAQVGGHPYGAWQ